MTLPAKPRIALVIPCYNDADFLRRCLVSVSQLKAPFDGVIVVDNNSTDESASVARAFGSKLIEEPRQGITWAASAGYDAALQEGFDIVVRIDADVVLSPDFSHRWRHAWQVAQYHSHKNVVALAGTARFDIPGWRGDVMSDVYLDSFRYSVGSALGHTPFFGSNSSLSLSWWSKIREHLDIADTYSHDDIQLSFAVGPKDTILRVPEISVDMDTRALRGRRQFLNRFSRGMHTMSRGLRHSFPLFRYLQRV